MIPGIPAESSAQIIKLLRSSPAVTGVILFGSRAKGNYREGSDIDIALMGISVNHELKDELVLKYHELFLPWKLDLVVYSLIEEPLLREHIDRVGVRVF